MSAKGKRRMRMKEWLNVIPLEEIDGRSLRSGIGLL